MKKHFDCIKLHFNAPLHLSRGRDHYDEAAQYLHSDTLASALFVAALKLGATPDTALEMLDDCRLTSAMPFVGTEYFFPRPLIPVPLKFVGLAEEKQAKSAKKLRYIGKNWFEKMIASFGEIEVDKERHIGKDTRFLFDGCPQSVFRSSVIQRVTIAPDNAVDSVPFFTERLFFCQNAGLYVMCQCNDDTSKELLFASFRLLGDLGIGTDKAVGNGFYEVEFTSMSLEVPDMATHICNLGLFLPRKDELSADDLNQGSWGLVKRGGYLAGAENEAHISLRKRSVYMFDVGAVFPNKHLEGKRVDLRPDYQGLNHSVWREGRPVFIPVTIS